MTNLHVDGELVGEVRVFRDKDGSLTFVIHSPEHGIATTSEWRGIDAGFDLAKGVLTRFLDEEVA